MKNGLGAVRSVLVLGGDSDIAIATVHALARRHTTDVVLAGRNPARLDARATELRAAHPALNVSIAAFDADDVDTHAPFFDDLFGRGDGFDLVLIAFGLLGDQAEGERDPSSAIAIARTNYLGGASALMHAGERLRRRGQGTVVVLSSVAAQRPRRSNFIYGASKAGLDALAEGMAFALRPEGVQVLTVRPGFVRTKMTTGLRAAPLATTPERVAEATVRAIAAGSELIWVPGTLRYVMWLLRLLPRPLFRRLPI